MRQTVKAYISTVTKLAARQGVDDVQAQVNAWPYPQERDSHIAIWRSAWEDKAGYIPANALKVAITGSGSTAVLLRVAEDAPTPKELISSLV